MFNFLNTFLICYISGFIVSDYVTVGAAVKECFQAGWVGVWNCADRGCIEATKLCDGVKDCADGSDETIKQCSQVHCYGYLFRCTYGACVHYKAACNGVVECADGSDESLDLCSKRGIIVGPMETPTTLSASDRMCVLPPYPDHGTYTATLGGKPGDAVSHTALTYTCEWGYRLIVEGSPICFIGYWFMKTPTCESQCKPLNSTSVEFKCYKQNSSLEIACDLPQENNSYAKATCRDSYYSEPPPRNLNCINGSWDYMPICTPVSCGRIMSTISGGTDFKNKEFPWKVEVLQPGGNNKQCALTDKTCWIVRCGGLLIGPKVALSAGGCGYNYRQQLKVRAGDWKLETTEGQKLYQEQLVNKIIVHPQYKSGNESELRYDATLLVMESPFTLADNIAFICLPPLNLDVASTSCKMVGFGHTYMTTGYQILGLGDWTYVDNDQCQWFLRQTWGSSFMLNYSYSCAGKIRGEGSCTSKNELIHSPLMCIAEDHYYARGLTSFNSCDNVTSLVAFTDIVKVRSWIDQEMRANGFTTDTYTHIAHRK